MPGPKFKDVSQLDSVLDGAFHLEKIMAYDANDNILYVGWARPGTAEGTSEWFIIKNTWVAGTVSGFNLTNTKVASDIPKFAYSWTARATFFV